MGIHFDREKQIFHLQAKDVSYVIQIMNGKYLAHVYWGKRIRKSALSNRIMFKHRVFTVRPASADRKFSLDTLPQEYPAHGTSDFRSPAYQIHQLNGSSITDLSFEAYRIIAGKPMLDGLPATYVETEEEATTLELTLFDQVLNLRVKLLYTVFEDHNAITRSAQFINQGEQDVRINKAMSMSVDMRDRTFDFLTLSGAHANECNISRMALRPGHQSVESTRGASSHQHQPFMALLDWEATEELGEVYAFSLVYSGNFLAQVEVDQFQVIRASMGINPSHLYWKLDSGKAFQTPEVVMVYSNKGLQGMTHTFHHLYRTRLCRGRYRDCLRPILLNNWEATYFRFNEEKLLALAEAGKELGIELFVLDDGWFGKRNRANSSLGDWIVNKEKLPSGLKGLGEKVVQMGMLFGLWFEPEMVSMDSDLYRRHPDWCLHVSNRPASIGRDQLVLDLTRREVCEYIIHSLSVILRSAPIRYVKWDMNRHMTEVGSPSLPNDRQGEVSHRYMLGLYRILDELTTAFPDVLFEGCSGGGGRFDPGMLFYMPQIWTSDNTDAIARLKIQYGTSLIYPAVAMCAHVSDIPNRQMGRVTSIETRGHAAMSGNLGYELDVTRLSEYEKMHMVEQVKLYKEIRNIIQFGQFYRLKDPFKSNEAAWQFVSQDKSESVVMYFRICAIPAAPFTILRLKGLDQKNDYLNTTTNLIYGGDELVHAGYSIPEIKGDFESVLLHFKMVKQQS